MNNTKVTPACLTLTEWAAALECIVVSIVRHDRLPYVVTPVGRVVMFGCCPLFCFPCCAWALLVRAFLCPFRLCCCHRGGICDGTESTECADVCMAACLEEADKLKTLPSLHPLALRNAMGSVAADAVTAAISVGSTLDLLDRQFAAPPYARKHYLLTVHVVVPLARQLGMPDVTLSLLPADVPRVLVEMRRTAST